MSEFKDDIQFLKELQTELKTQETDCQSAPRFWVIMDYEDRVTEQGHHDKVFVYDTDTAESYELMEYCKQIADEDDSSLWPETIQELKEYLADEDESELVEWVKDHCNNASIIYTETRDVIKRDTMFLTKQEAKNHLRSNAHHYTNKAHTYAMTAWRAPKVERLLKILETFDWDVLAKVRGESHE